jgi:anhydro-N-acetylmuramic acid kinase
VLNTVGTLFKVIGTMSGTSLDGVDAALLSTDGESVAHPGPALTVPYRPDARAVLLDAVAAARTLRQGEPTPSIMLAAERVLTDVHSEAVALLLQREGLKSADIDLVGFHGQTVLHRPAERWTWQVGDGAALARALGIAVVNDFRSADVAAGGQGAPFVPLYHHVLARGQERPLAVVNIGGVANVTYIGSDDHLLAFDTGPGNAALDDWAFAHTGTRADIDGRLARSGRVDEKRLAALLGHPALAVPPPKSFDRFDFPMSTVDGLSGPDGAATLTAFSAAAIARAREHFPDTPQSWIICGGGRHNPVLMEELRRRIGPTVKSAEDAGWPGDFVEAQAFGYLAVRSIRGLPLSVPTTTGVPYPMPGGRLHRPP